MQLSRLIRPRLRLPLLVRVLWVLALVPAMGTGTALSMTAATGTGTPEKTRAYYQFSLAQQARFRSDFPDAVRHLEEAIRAADSSDLRLELAGVYSTMNKPEEAEREAREAVRLDPGSASARSTLAQILFQQAAAGADATSRLKESESLYQELLEKGQAEEEAALALADLQTGRADPAAAVASLEKFSADHPGSVEVAIRLARLYLDVGRSAEARQLLEGVLDKDDDNRDARQLLADILEDAGEAAKAVEVFRPVTDANPGNAYTQYRLGTLLNSAGNFDEAQEHLQTALQSDPGNVRILLALGQAALGTGDNRLAEDLYQRALDRDAASLEARFFLGRIAQARAEDDRALALYGQILSQTAEKATPQDRAFFGLASFQKAVIFYLQRRYPEAVPPVRDALEAASHPSEDLYGLLVRIHLDAGKLSDAEVDLEQAKAALPGSLEMQALEGEVRLRHGDRTGARGIFRALANESKGSAAGYLLILQSCSRAEASREGEVWAREAAEKNPDSEEIAFQQAALLERAGRFRDSETAFHGLLERYPDNAEALNYLGYMLADRGVKLEEALGLIQRAVSLQHDNAAFLDSLGWVYFRMGKFEQAEGYLERAAQGSREDPTVLEHLGDVKARLGKSSEALKAYRTALDRGPEDPEALKKKIRKLGDSPAKP